MFVLKGFDAPVPVYRVDPTHRTQIFTDEYIMIADLKGFDAFTIAEGVAAAERLRDAWKLFKEQEGYRLPINIAVHKGAVHVFRSYLWIRHEHCRECREPDAFSRRWRRHLCD